MERASQDSFLRIPEVAARYHVPVPTVRGWVYKGTGPRSYKIGRHRLFRLTDLIQWEDGQADRPALGA